MKSWSIILSVIICGFGCTYIGEPNQTYQNNIYETADYIAIQHNDSIPNKGLLFYPGGLVDAGVYKDWCDQLISARPDMVVLIIKMPLNLAVFSPEKGLKYMEKYNHVNQWLIGGHSLGGTMAARLIHKQPDTFKGLVLLGSYPAESDDLSAWNGNALSLSAEHDGLSTPDKIEENKTLLPPAYTMSSEINFPTTVYPYTAYYQIPGGNHAQFGSYGVQKKDGEATITAQQQHDVMVLSIQTFIHILCD